MLRNWLILSNDEVLNEEIETVSSYLSFKTIKEIRVSLLSGKHTGVVLLSIAESDELGLSGFISGVKNHPALSKVQVVVLDSLKSLFPGDDQVGLKFLTADQISKLIDCPINIHTPINNGLSQQIETLNTTHKLPTVTDNIEHLKHLSAKAIATMIQENEVYKSRDLALEIFLRRVREGGY